MARNFQATLEGTMDTSLILLISTLQMLRAELARRQAEAFAEQPAERARTFESYGETDRSYGLVGSLDQPPGSRQTAFLHELHGSLMKRQLEHSVEMIRRQVGGLRCHRHAHRFTTARA